jgi:hypothetical protein
MEASKTNQPTRAALQAATPQLAQGYFAAMKNAGDGAGAFFTSRYCFADKMPIR